MQIKEIIKNKILSKNKKRIQVDSLVFHEHGKGFVTFMKKAAGDITLVTYRLESDYSFWKCIKTKELKNEH